MLEVAVSSGQSHIVNHLIEDDDLFDAEEEEAEMSE